MIDRISAISEANEAAQLRDQFKTCAVAEVSEAGVKTPTIEVSRDATAQPTFGLTTGAP